MHIASSRYFTTFCQLFWMTSSGQHWHEFIHSTEGLQEKCIVFPPALCLLITWQRHHCELLGHTRLDIHAQWLPLRCRDNRRDGVSNHQPHDCLLNRLFGRRSKKTSKLCVTGLCVGNSPGTGEFPAQKASNGENVSIWWRHYVSIGAVPADDLAASPLWAARTYTHSDCKVRGNMYLRDRHLKA